MSQKRAEDWLRRLVGRTREEAERTAAGAAKKRAAEDTQANARRLRDKAGAEVDPAMGRSKTPKIG